MLIMNNANCALFLICQSLIIVKSTIINITGVSNTLITK